MNIAEDIEYNSSIISNSFNIKSKMDGFENLELNNCESEISNISENPISTISKNELPTKVCLILLFENS